MELKSVKETIPKELYGILEKEITKLRPAQEKSIKKGLLNGKNLLVCTPTTSGKTLIAELAMLKSIIEGKGKAIYIVPLKALASEKFKDFKRRYGKIAKIALSIGDIDSTDNFLAEYDLVVNNKSYKPVKSLYYSLKFLFSFLILNHILKMLNSQILIFAKAKNQLRCFAP